MLLPYGTLWKELQDAFEVLGIFKNRCKNVLTSRELINFMLMQSLKLRCYIMALTMLCQQTVRTLCSYSKLDKFAGMKLLTIIAVTWDDRELTLRRKNSLISTIPEQKYINTWCLRRISLKGQQHCYSGHNSPTFSFTKHTKLSD